MKTKQYFVEFTSDTRCCGSYQHGAGNAGSIKSAKSIIRNMRKMYADTNPRDFCVYDRWADVDPKTNFVPCVYSEK